MTPPLAKRLRRFIRFVLLRTAVALASLLPLRWAQSLGDALGSLAYYALPKEKEKALASLARAFPEKGEAERLELARACFRHLGRCALEAAVARRLGPAGLDRLVEVPEEAKAALLGAMAKGGGVVAVSGHVGNWELFGWALVRLGLPLHVIAREGVDARLGTLAEDFRKRGGVRTILRGAQGAGVAMLRALRGGAMLGFLVDQDTRVQSVAVPFFGTPAATPRAPADLTLRTGAPTVVGFLQRTPSGRYSLSAAQLDVPHSGDTEADVRELTARYSAAVEAAVRRAPAQWVWMHQRWKTVC